MKNFILFTGIFLLGTECISQSVDGKLQFEQGRVYSINVRSEVKVSQEAMGQAIDFNVTSDVVHQYKVTNATSENTTLHHGLNRVTFKFDGMGQENSFDSEKPGDLNGEFGGPIREMMSKTYDVIVDPSGTALMSKPDTFSIGKAGDGAMLVTTMLKDQFAMIYPPKKGEASFFKILPNKAVEINEGWVENTTSGENVSNTVYTLTEITDSTYIIKFKGTATTTTFAEMMGMETVTKMNDQFTGTITVDKVTGILKEKITTTESNGTTEVMGGSLPVTSKATVTVRVN